MTATFASLGLGSLNAEEKLEVVGQLWDDLLPPGGGLSDAQREELRQRAAKAVARPNEWVSWDEALKATLGRLSG